MVGAVFWVHCIAPHRRLIDSGAVACQGSCTLKMAIPPFPHLLPPSNLLPIPLSLLKSLKPQIFFGEIYSSKCELTLVLTSMAPRFELTAYTPSYLCPWLWSSNVPVESSESDTSTEPPRKKQRLDTTLRDSAGDDCYLIPVVTFDFHVVGSTPWPAYTLNAFLPFR